MKRLVILVTILCFPALSWAPPSGGGGVGISPWLVYSSGYMAPINSGWGVAVGGTGTSANAYATSAGLIKATSFKAGSETPITSFTGSGMAMSGGVLTSGDFQSDGTVPMTGALNMGSQIITAVGTVDGVDISALATSVLKDSDLGVTVGQHYANADTDYLDDYLGIDAPILWAPFDDPDSPLKMYTGGPLTFTRATTATYIHPVTGLVTTASANQLRIESDGALIEGQRTNLVLRSAEMDNAVWATTNISVVADTLTSPDGTKNAELLSAATGSGTLIQDLGVVASAAKTFSIYLKRKTGTGNIDLTVDGGAGWTTKTITSSWARYSITQTVADPDIGIRIVTSGDEVWAWGGQLEDSASFPSSYIPTGATAVTRNADVLTAGNSNLSVPCTIATGVDFFNTGYGTIFTTYDPTRQNGASLIVDSAASGLDREYWVGGINDNSLDIGNGAIGSEAVHKISMKLPATGGGEANIFVDGTAVDPESTRDPSVASHGGNLTIGSRGSTVGGIYLYGHIKNLRIWNKALTDAKMVYLTTYNPEAIYQPLDETLTGLASGNMTEALNMGSQIITNVGTVDGVDISDHAASTTIHHVPSYASIYATNKTVTVNTAETMYLMTAGWTMDHASGVSYNGTTGSFEIDASAAGVYSAHWSMSIIAGNSDDIQCHIMVEGVEHPEGAGHIDMAPVASSMTLTAPAMLALVENDSVVLHCRNDTDTDNFTIAEGNFSLHRID